ncbi:MAG: efflux RND transporter permease subunit, partial [Deltaproteobacteria bacterium]|nr:efflux RND transporter permease subunit [Deltaproteobacteria bacterium]
KEHVAELQATLPQGLHAAPWFDAAEIYEQRLSLLMRNAGIGLLLVLLILGLFLEARLAFWVTLGIPISFSGALLLFPAADLSINMISLFGFIVTLGMVVDDAIVIGEAIYKQQSEGKGLLESAIAGAKEVAQPVVFAIVTTCVAFAPMLLVPGVMGKFFRVLPTLVIAVLLISLLESLLILPAHLSHAMPWWLRTALAPYLWLMERVSRLEVPRRLEEFIKRGYLPLLRRALRWRYFTIAAGVAIVILTAGVVAGRVPFTFMPKVEGDLITAQLKLPVGTPIAVTERVTERISAAARSVLEDAEQAMAEPKPISRGLYQDVGATSTLEPGFDGVFAREGTERSTVMIYLVSSDERELTTQAIGEIPGAESMVFRYEFGIEPGSPVDIQLIHEDVATLEMAAQRLASEIASYSGLRDIDSGVTKGKEQLDFRLTDVAVAQGLTEIQLARQVRASFFGSEALRQQRGRDEVRVYVRLPREERESLYHVDNLIIRTPSGGELPMSEAATVSRGQAYTVINRTDGRRNISVMADVADEDTNANEINAQILRRELPQLLADIPGLAYDLASRADHDFFDSRSRIPKLLPTDSGDVRHPFRHGRRGLGPRADGLQPQPDEHARLGRAVRGRGQRFAHPHRGNQSLPRRRRPRLVGGRSRGWGASLPPDPAHLTDDVLRACSDHLGNLGAGALLDPDGGVAGLRSARGNLHHVADHPVRLPHPRRRPPNDGKPLRSAGRQPDDSTPRSPNRRARLSR